jgi:serine phosphatase RsbU (regulator of sigma subunit)
VGTGVLLFTDGLTEARLDRELFGEARVSEALASYGAAAPSEVVGRLTQAVEAFAPGELPDDLCLLAARMA